MPTIKGCSKIPPAYEIPVSEQQVNYESSRSLDEVVRSTVIAGSRKKPPIGTNYAAVVEY